MSVAHSVFGISHLVIGTHDLDAAEQFAASSGYQRRGEVRAGRNPIEKATVMDAPVSDTFDMRLMASGNGLPALELLREGPRPWPSARRFEAVFCGRETSAATVRRAMALPPPFPGFRRAADGDASSVAVVVRCPNPAASASFWAALGERPRPEGTAERLDIRGLVPSSRASLFFVPGGTDDAECLNREGLNCLSFFCRDSDELRERLAASGCLTSACFDLAPFGRKLRVFFARPRTGELYEFLAVDRSFSVDSAPVGGSAACP